MFNDFTRVHNTKLNLGTGIESIVRCYVLYQVFPTRHVRLVLGVEALYPLSQLSNGTVTEHFRLPHSCSKPITAHFLMSVTRVLMNFVADKTNIPVIDSEKNNQKRVGPLNGNMT